MDYDLEMSDDGAKKAMSNFFKSFPGIAKYIKTQKKLVNKYGKVKNLIGKIYDLPDGMLEVTDRRNYDIFKRKARAERQATNYPIQGGASSIITVAMRDIRNYFIERGNWMKNLFLVSQIHDKKMLLLSCINLLICWKVLKARYESGKSNLIRNQF
jgi:DNA polymerase I-like protein with 3'-5' exonuclease and polymerase domains